MAVQEPNDSISREEIIKKLSPAKQFHLHHVVFKQCDALSREQAIDALKDSLVNAEYTRLTAGNLLMGTLPKIGDWKQD